jgi:hypothetical protein
LSLKVFHVLFIVLSILLTIGFGIWGVMQSGGMLLALGIISFFIGILLVFYLIKVVAKFRQIET